MFPKILSYNKFISSYAKKFNDMTNNDIGGYNLSAGTKTFMINGRIYNLFATRVSLVPYHSVDTEIIPGNTNCDKSEKEFKEKKTEPVKNIIITQKNFDSRYKKIPEDDYGKNFVWNAWNIPRRNHSNIFIGEITKDNTIIEKEIVYENEIAIDSRILYLKTIEFQNIYDNLYLFLIIPRNLINNLYHLIIIKYKNEDDSFISKLIKISTNIMRSTSINNNLGLNSNSINTTCYKFEIIENDLYESDELHLYYFNWFENNCITQFINVINIPSSEYLKKNFLSLKKIEYYNHLTLKKNPIKTLESQLIKCELEIKNNFLNGDYKYEKICQKIYRIKNLEMSFGTPFIKTINNKLLGIGHSKLLSNDNIYVYKSEKLIRLQKLIPDILRKLFNNKYKQHHSSFFPGCISGNNYFSYFIKYDDINKTFFISDFFIPIDTSDKYHFSLIFTVGIFNIDNYTYITSGEGDYYNSIIKYDTNDILCSCIHDVLDSGFNYDKINFYFQIKCKNKIMKNVLIDDTLNVDDIYENCVNIDFPNLEHISLSSQSKKYLKKYFKYKKKYLDMKKDII